MSYLDWPRLHFKGRFQADTSTVNNTPGDTDLNGLTTSPTFDACTLEFDFSCPSASQISFQYVFTSEEYNEYVNSQFNDVFGFFLNGVNIATLPGGMSVAINNVNVHATEAHLLKVIHQGG